MDRSQPEFSYVVQVRNGFQPDVWTTVKEDLTMTNGAETLESFRRVNPSREFRLIPTDWVEGIRHG